MEDNKTKKMLQKNDSKKLRKYLPIGTVVLLKNAKKRIMITGFCAVKEENKKSQIFDYCGVLYPEGVVKVDQVCLFNHKQIEKVFHMGLYKDEEERAFKKKLIQLVKENEKNEK